MNPRIDQEDFRDQIDISLSRDKILEVLCTLRDRETEIIYLFFFENLKLKDMTSIFNISQTRLSQVFHKALRKIKHPIRSNKLKESYNSMFIVY